LHPTRHYCEDCEGFVRVAVNTRYETYPVRGTDIRVRAEVAVCEDCGAVVPDEALDERNLRKAFDVYRGRKNILGPRDIRRIRERYGLSQRGFSRLLGFGDVTIHRYETGAVPDEAHNALIRHVGDAGNMRAWLRDRADDLPDHVVETVTEHLAREEAGEREMLSKVMGDDQSMRRSIRGYAHFSPEKVAEVVRYFAKEISDLWQTKLAKLLWYADFLHYRRHAVSITGLRYAHMPFGPGPDRYDALLQLLQESGHIVKRPKVQYHFEGEIIEPSADVECTDPHLDGEEWETVRAVASELGHLTSQALSDRSHRELAWLETGEGDLIPYSYARDLTLGDD